METGDSQMPVPALSKLPVIYKFMVAVTFELQVI